MTALFAPSPLSCFKQTNQLHKSQNSFPSKRYTKTADSFPLFNHLFFLLFTFLFFFVISLCELNAIVVYVIHKFDCSSYVFLYWISSFVCIQNGFSLSFICLLHKQRLFFFFFYVERWKLNGLRSRGFRFKSLKSSYLHSWVCLLLSELNLWLIFLLTFFFSPLRRCLTLIVSLFVIL